MAHPTGSLGDPGKRNIEDIPFHELFPPLVDEPTEEQMDWLRTPPTKPYIPKEKRE